MNAQIMPHYFGAQEIRTVTIDGEPWFVARDVAEVLGYKDTVNAVKQHCRGVVKRHPIIDALGRTQEVRIIREPDLYRLTAGSTLPAAARFEAWIFEEVLPTLRKRGRYSTPGRRRRFETPEDFADCGANRADIFHHRGPVSKSGLDIRYALDLTKIALNPHPRSLEVLQRLTGVDMDDLITELEERRAREDADGSAGMDVFILERMERSPGCVVGATQLYKAFCRWFDAEYMDKPHRPPMPTQRLFGKWLRRQGYTKRRQHNGYVYCNVALKD